MKIKCTYCRAFINDYDEAYAVNELYMKLKEEILHQKENNLHSAPKKKKIS